jgi:hypothetical protein
MPTQIGFVFSISSRSTQHSERINWLCFPVDSTHEYLRNILSNKILHRFGLSKIGFVFSTIVFATYEELKVK